jgi:hypothetical protein
MKNIAYYKEFNKKYDRSLLDYLSETPMVDKEKILLYLKNGQDFGVRCSSIYDYVKNEPTFKDINLYTDGIYHWDDEKIYHFEKYNMKLEDDFIKHVLSA